MTDIFPIIQPEAEPSVQARLPLCREVAWDFTQGIPVYAGGRPVEVTGVEAVKVWIWKALKTAADRPINRQMAGPHQRANAVPTDGDAHFSCALTAVLINRVRRVAGDGAELEISCRVSTIYGEAEVTAHV